MPLPAIVQRWILALAIGVALYGLGWLQGAHHEQIKAERFQAASEALGRAQLAHVEKTNRRQRQNLERANHDIKQANRDAAANAVRNYLARTRWLQHPGAGGGAVPGSAAGQQGDDAAGRERLAVEPDREFIEACARDAGRLGVWQGWAIANRLPVE